MNMIKRQYGTAVKVDEINQILGKEINGYPAFLIKSW